MKKRADICRQKAEDCQCAAARVADPEIQASYRQMSRQWNEMAERQQAIENALVNAGKAPMAKSDVHQLRTGCNKRTRSALRGEPNQVLRYRKRLYFV